MKHLEKSFYAIVSLLCNTNSFIRAYAYNSRNFFRIDYKLSNQIKNKNPQLYANKKPIQPLIKGQPIGVDEEEISLWEQEELELQRLEATESYDSDEIEDYDDEFQLSEKYLRGTTKDRMVKESKPSSRTSDIDLPEYMNKILSSFEEAKPGVSLPASKLPTVAVIGRPNTGKSTLVNKLADSYKNGAIIHDEAGITRDRTYRTGRWGEYYFQVIDTGGIIFDDSDDIFADRITEQALLALKEADVAILVCDGQVGVQPLDSILSEWMRRNCKIPIYVAANKCESEKLGMMQAQDFWSLGLGNPYPISAIHGAGVGDLLDQITSKHMQKVSSVIPENATNVAFIGRPNVGKSSLFNTLYGSARTIVSNIAGTTRDVVDAVITRRNNTYRIIDTAGIRRKPKVEYGAEFFMVNRAFKAIKRSDVVVLMLDAVDGIVEQDRILAERIDKDGRGCIIALNKWDLVADKDDKTYLKAIENIRSALPVLKWAEVILVSALTGQRTEKILEAVDRAADQFRRRIPTAILNEVVQEATLWLAPPTIGSRSGRIYYAMQVAIGPPTIVFFCNDPALFNDNYRTYLERKLRDSLQFEGAPIKMIFRGKAVRDASRDLQRNNFKESRESSNRARAK